LPRRPVEHHTTALRYTYNKTKQHAAINAYSDRDWKLHALHNEEHFFTLVICWKMSKGNSQYTD